MLDFDTGFARDRVLARPAENRRGMALANVDDPGTNNYFTEMCSGSEEGSSLRLIDLCITQL